MNCTESKFPNFRTFENEFTLVKFNIKHMTARNKIKIKTFYVKIKKSKIILSLE